MAVVLGPNRTARRRPRRPGRPRTATRHADQATSTSASRCPATWRDAHLTGDNAEVLPTDTQKNTVYAFATRHGIGADRGRSRCCWPGTSSTTSARSTAPGCAIEEYAWERIEVASRHSFVRAGRRGAHRAWSTRDARRRAGWSSRRCKDLVVLNTTGSEFTGFLKDGYTTLPETTDRVLATAVDAALAHAGARTCDWDASYDAVRGCCSRRSPTRTACSLQQTLYAMGERVLTARARGRARCGWRCRTSTTSWSTCRRSGWTTTTRSSTPPTGRTG